MDDEFPDIGVLDDEIFEGDALSGLTDRMSIDEDFSHSNKVDRSSMENNYKTKRPTSGLFHSRSPTQGTAGGDHKGHPQISSTNTDDLVNMIANDDVSIQVVGREYDPKSGNFSDAGGGFRWSWDEIKLLFKRPFSSNSRGSANRPGVSANPAQAGKRGSSNSRYSIFRWSFDDVQKKFRSLGHSGEYGARRNVKRERKDKSKKKKRKGRNDSPPEGPASDSKVRNKKIKEEQPSGGGGGKGKSANTPKGKQVTDTFKISELVAEGGGGATNSRARRVKKTQRERQRRDKVSTLFENLGTLVGITPQSGSDAVKDPNSSRAAILSTAVDTLLKKKGLPPRYADEGGMLNTTMNPKFESQDSADLDDTPSKKKAKSKKKH